MKLIAPLFVAAACAFTVSAFAQDAQTAAAVAKPDLAKGEASYAMCAGCHGIDGNSPAPTYPKLAQQHPAYIVKQLQEFKSGKRASPVMQGFATALSDEDMKNVAYFITTKKAAAGASTDKALVSMGERIYRGGIADRKIAACSGCHSPNGAGIPAQYPRLAGQWGDYVAAQLIAFRDGARGNSSQMAQIAAKMNDKEIKAVSDYIAGLR